MTYPLVVVANRLPVDLTVAEDGTSTWSRSPGGLVSALEPVMRSTNGAWVGWSGSPGDAPEPFDADGMHLVPVSLSEQEIADYYEGFSNDTLWPLSHDVISTPEYHRHWWEAYRRVNERFARIAKLSCSCVLPATSGFCNEYTRQHAQYHQCERKVWLKD